MLVKQLTEAIRIYQIQGATPDKRAQNEVSQEDLIRLGMSQSLW